MLLLNKNGVNLLTIECHTHCYFLWTKQHKNDRSGQQCFVVLHKQTHLGSLQKKIYGSNSMTETNGKIYWMDGQMDGQIDDWINWGL